MVEGRVAAPHALDARSPARALRVGLVLTGVLLGLTTLPLDDGLRHVGQAFGAERSWGEVYPYSAFAELGGYNPWYGFDYALRVIADVAQQLPLPQLVQQLVLVKLLSVLWAVSMLWLCARRARLAEALDDPVSILCAFAVVFFMIGPAVGRAGTIRPFVIGTLVLVYSFGQRGFLRGALSSSLVLACYPYLAFVYTVPLAIAHALRGSRSFALGVAVATLVATVLAPQGQWTMLGALAQANLTRAATGLQIIELRSAAGEGAWIIMLLLLAALIAPRLPKAAFELRVPHVVAACFMPAAIMHVRYLADVVLVCLFVAHGADLTRLLRSIVGDAVARWHALRGSPAGPAQPERPSPVLLAVLALGYLAGAGMLWQELGKQRRGLEARRRELARVPSGARVLTEFNTQYEMLFVRPDLSLVPSCELGVPSASVREPYIAYFARGRVCELAHAVGASHFVEARGKYIDPTDSACLQLLPEPPRAPASGPEPKLRVFAVER